MADLLIRNLDWLIVWDAVTARHAYARGWDLAVTGGVISHLGPGFTGTAARVIDGRGLMAMPGLVNVHSHASYIAVTKGLYEESAVPNAPDPVAGVLHVFSPLMTLREEEKPHALNYALAELLLSGCTAICDLAFAWDGWLDTLAASGMRAWAAVQYASARYVSPNGHTLAYDWDTAGDAARLSAAIAVAERAAAHPSGRLSPMLVPAQVDSCSEALFRDTAAVAAERGWVMQTHAAQTEFEVREMMQRHGCTSIAWLDRIGFLGPRTTLGHVVFTDQHPWMHLHARDDLPTLARTGTTVAHCPTTQTRRGKTLQSFARYRRAGIAMALGTDIHPHHMLDELRCATVMAKVADGDAHALFVDATFEAATVGGARALNRPDLGRLADGCRADIVLVDTGHWTMKPLRDPLRSLVFSGLERPVRHVFVDGVQVVADGRCLTIDIEAAAAGLDAAQKRMLRDVPSRDSLGRSIDAIIPLSLPMLG